ncbi:MAG: hypothetical protein WKF42_02085 [Solirubrobacteraceae bacterium]
MRLVIPAAAILTVLLVPSPAHAAKPWGAPETVSRAPGFPAVAIGPNGRAVLAWSANNTAYGARRSSSRGFGEPFALYKQRSAVGFNTVAFDADGNALFAFRRFVGRNHRILGATLRPGGSRTGAISLSGPGSSAYEPTFATPPGGTYVDDPTLAWWRRNNPVGLPPTRVQLARATSGRLLVSENDSLPSTFDARYAQTLDGTVFAATTTSRSAVVAARAPGGSFSAPQTLDSGNGPFRAADIAVGVDGTVAVSWLRFDGSTYRMFVAVRRAGRAFEPAVAVSGAGERAVATRVVVTSRGNVRAAYLSTAPGNRGSAAGRLRLVTVGGAGVTVTAGAQRAIEFDIAADARGGVTLAWTRRVGRSYGGAVFARAVTPSGRLGSRRQLTAPGEDARGIDLALGARGDGLVAWQTADLRRLRAVSRGAS